MQRTLPNAWANTVYLRYITYCTVIHTVRHWYLMYEIEGITNWVLKATKNIETEIFSAVRQLNMQKVVHFLSVSITQLQFSVSSHAGLWTQLPCIVLKTIWISAYKLILPRLERMQRKMSGFCLPFRDSDYFWDSVSPYWTSKRHWVN